MKLYGKNLTSVHCLSKYAHFFPIFNFQLYYRTKGPGRCDSANPTFDLLPQKLPIVGESNPVIAELAASGNADVPSNEQVLTATGQDDTDKQQTQDDIPAAVTTTTRKTPTTEPELTRDLSQPDAIDIITTGGLAEPLSTFGMVNRQLTRN